MEIVEENRMLYDDYVNGVEVCDRTSPIEASYQDTFKLVFDAALKFTNIETIISKDFPRKCTKIHCPLGYKIEGTASPDLILAEYFVYHNRNNKNFPKPKYHALVEVKKPNAIKITDDGEVKINLDDYNQLEKYLKHPAINKLIFTDGYTWIFYYKTLKPQKIIELRCGKAWKYSSNSFPDYVQNLLGTNEKIPCKPKEWGELHSYILDFIVDNC